MERPPAATIPEVPGSYQFLDADGRVVYVGKAKSLRSRIVSYFGAPAQLNPRTAQLMSAAASLEWITVATEVDALMLEYSLIQRHQPRFNVRYRDDKSYPFLCVTLVDEWPRAMVVRGSKRKGNRYFGPYGHAYAIRETLDLLLRTFPIRTCSDNKFADHQRLGRPCLLYHIERCAGPCVGEIDREAYRGLVGELLDFLAGDTGEILRRLEADMAAAAEALDFERAAQLRDRLASVRKAVERQEMVGSRAEDLDVFGVASDELEAAVSVFFVRKGRVMGQRGFIVDRAEDLSGSELMGRVLERIYFDENPLGYPKAVLVPEPPAAEEMYADWLGGLRGSKVQIRVPQRGAKRRLAETAHRNAADSLHRHRLKRASDHNSRARALNELQQYLGLPEAPLRIECYDMSHLGGQDYVGSMVVMEDALPRKSEYRRFRLRKVASNNDLAAMEEVLERRLRNYLDSRGLPPGERGRFAYPPQLLLVDGGAGQLGVAKRVLARLGLAGEIPAAALAKQFEEVFVPDQPEAVRIPRQSEALYLLQRIRDESHRFALAYHRQLRGKRMTASALDGIAGLGPARRKRLVAELGGVGAVRRSSLEDLRSLSWLPERVAEAVHAKFHA
ncbi:MAG: excinuclease ABC subunit UvrC [Acidimicrobiia bacterium]|nr:excinuclease ABC subunit UvrC [Acidimicrobiia bacterium]